MSAPQPALPNVELSFGPMLIGVFFNLILYGVLIGQVLTYYQTYRKDASWMKFFVFGLFTIATANTGFDMAFMYQPLILQFGEKPNLFPTFFVTGMHAELSLWTRLLTVGYLLRTSVYRSGIDTHTIVFRLENRVAHKIVLDPRLHCRPCFGVLYWWRVDRRHFLCLSNAGFILIACAVMIRIVKTFANKPKLHNSALLWFLSSCVADILITVSLVLTLMRRKTGFSGTDSVIDKIIRMTIQTGMLTAVFAVLDVICFMVFPHFAVNFVWDLCLSKLYINCLMSTLNARAGLNGISGSGGVSEPRRNMSRGITHPTSPTNGRHPDTFVDHSQHLNSSAVYELDTQKSTYDVESGYAMPSRDEYGIQVTKVIERVKDPIPHPYTQ
ncbi:hypothetical protein C8R47DRAFT_1227594 [Mycena vitilis]|nr:hypothetical protein C8R47DRAFT_1227594 [Mycena vitilis]